MSTRQLGAILARDTKLGPRSPFVLYAIVLPLIVTFLIQGVFGTLFAPEPRLDIVDEGASEITVAAMDLDGITVTLVEDRQAMLDRVEANDADAGLYLPAGFDQRVASGSRPELSLVVGGESLASNRIILAVTTLTLIRGIEGTEPPVAVEVEQLGEPGLDISQRILPLLLMMVMAIAAGFVPASGLVQEREDRTLSALLVSPASMGDILGAKAIFGFSLAVVTGLVTLWINGAINGNLGGFVLTLIVAAAMMVEIGLVLGSWAPDSNTLFAAFKGGAVLLIFPAVFFLFPALPQWIARLGPTFYFLDPAFRLASEGATLADVALTLLIGAAICLAMVPLVVIAGRRMERTLATG